MPPSDKISRYVGPWPDGLITRHEGSYDVAESFVGDIINLDVTDYGVLIQRPGFVRFHDAWADGWPGSFTNFGTFRLLGSHPSAINGNLRLYVSILKQVTGTWRERVYYTDDPTTGSPTQLFENDHGASKPADNKLINSVVLYNGELFFIRRGAASAGTFQNNISMDNGDTTGATANALTLVQSQFGYYSFVMQDRVFVVDLNGSKVNYSKATAPRNWTAPDGGFFSVNPLDAQQVTAVIALEDIVYIFKEDSTWAFTFNTDPAVDGILRQVNKQFGALDATNKGSDIYVVNRQGIYRFIDGEFLSIAENIRTIIDSPDSWGESVSITIVANRLILGGFFESGSYTSLCMNLNTGAWTKYDPSDSFISANSKRSFAVSSSSGTAWQVWGDTPSAVVDGVLNSGGGYFSMMRIGGDINNPDGKCKDQDRSGNFLVPRYMMVTVPLAMDDATRWKKLYRWRYDLQHVDADNLDAKPTFSIREGDPSVVDASQLITNYADFYTDFFDSVVTKQQRFRVIQFGIDKAETATGSGITDQVTFRVRGLTMDYSIRGLIRT